MFSSSDYRVGVFVLFAATALQMPRAAVSQGDAGDCWWTGCQSSAWLVTGCNQYHRTQNNIKKCDGGSEYYCCAGVGSQQIAEDCWWTGCQLNEWQVKGCSNYNRTETAREQCPDGLKYKCCTGMASASGRVLNPSLQKEECWWTGCQPNDWLVKGCESYNRTETAREQCPDGLKYKCCADKPATIQLQDPSSPKEDCWWTGCQPNDWLIKGCESYNRTETAREQCPDGLKYKCCAGKPAAIQLQDLSSPKEDCWWTGCQPNDWLVKGCESYNRTETAREQCPDGLKYKCCAGTPTAVHLPDLGSPKEECWWTGCQPNDWLVKGCESYNRTETAREQCPDGLKYKCCAGMPVAIHLPDPSSPKEDCWWTGCQPNAWLVKGCESYNRKEAAREQCPDGLKYKCCAGMPDAVQLPDVSLPKEECWWTGCQPNDWLVKGCESYNRTETAREPCPDGLKYKCCPGMPVAVQLPDQSSPKEDCWWTGCQPNDWLVKGCQNYKRIEKEREQCQDGLKYKCCEDTAVVPVAVTRLPNSSSVPEEKCWWTGCQLTKWNIRGCPSNTIQTGTHACPEGDLFQCCLTRKKSITSYGTIVARDDHRK